MWADTEMSTYIECNVEQAKGHDSRIRKAKRLWLDGDLKRRAGRRNEKADSLQTCAVLW